MLGITDKNRQWKALVVIGAVYLPFILSISFLTGHLQRLGDASLFFSANDAQGYKLIADYYVSFGHSERPPNDLLKLRPFLFPLYLGVYHLIGIAGFQLLQLVMNTTSLWLLFVSVKAVTGRPWIAYVSGVLIALNPTFNFIAFHALTETVSIFLICLFIFLVEQYAEDPRETKLFWPAIVLSALVCIRPIVLPFWCVFMGYYCVASFRTRRASVGRTALSLIPLVVQLVIAFAMTGSATISSAGRIVFEDWYFPAVYTQTEYGRFISRKSDEAKMGKELFPAVPDKINYVVEHYRESLTVYFRTLLHRNLIDGTYFARPPVNAAGSQEPFINYVERWAKYLNRLFTCIHVVMLALALTAVIMWRNLGRRHKLWTVYYVFATLLVLPAGLTYNAGDRYVTVADPVWLVAYAALFGLLIEVLLSWRGKANARALNLSS